ncbi:LysM domain-containing protein [Streptomyces sp. WMMB 714]|nr:LysM domain-containing protein [Streptomyces sp. WMMB 714]
MPPLFSGNGRHRRPRQAPSFVVTAGVTGAGIALPLLGATGANAADTSTWDKVAECESGGLWSADEDNGFYGGLQLDQETWEEFGGTDFAERPDLASRGQQIEVAEKILEGRGTEVWSDCAESAGLSADSGETPDVTEPDGSEESYEPVPERPYPTDPSDSAPEGDGSSSGDGGSGDGDTSEGSGEASPSPGDTPDDSGDSSGSGESDGSGESADPDESGESDYPSYPGGDSESGDGSEGGATGGSGESSDSGGSDGSADSGDSSDSDDASGPDGSGDGSEGGRGDADEHPSREGDDARPGSGADAEGHRVAPGESLSGIAEEYGVQGGWPELYESNRDVVGSDPDLIRPGQELRF